MNVEQEIKRYFPYPRFRKGQREIAEAVYEAVKNREHVIVEGPSGLGKTSAVLAGLMPHILENETRVLFLARTHRELDRVIEELRLISRITPVSGISIRGKREMCINKLILEASPDHKTHVELCSLAIKKGKCIYYENLFKKDLLLEDLVEKSHSTPLKASEIFDLGRKIRACPYEILKILMSDVHVVAASYVYLLHPYIYENFVRSLYSGLDTFAIVIDEAHNFPETAINVLSDSITINSLKGALKEAKIWERKDLANFISIVLEYVVEKARELAAGEVIKLELKELMDIVYDELGMAFEVMADTCRAYGEYIKQRLLAQNRPPKSHIHRVGEFSLRLWETYELDTFIQVVSKDLSGKVSFEIVSLDPRQATEPIFREARATVSMSGTLKPYRAYTDVVGVPGNTKFIEAPSPFSENQVLVLAVNSVSTRYPERTLSVYRDICRMVGEAVKGTPGNTGVFTASYEVLNGLIRAGIANYVKKRLFIDRPGMSSKEMDNLISSFKSAAASGGGVLLSVQGGRASEGEDYPGDQMNTVVIVGVAFARPNVKINAQIRYYEKLFPGKGRLYGYVYPAIRKAAQAAGRPFRLLSDKGVIIFLDKRFLRPYMRENLPKWISTKMRVISGRAGQIERLVSLFYKVGLK